MSNVKTDSIPAKQRDHQYNPRSALYRYFKEITGTKSLTSEQESQLARHIRTGDQQAANQLVRHNLLFVVNVAKAYDNQGLPLIDLIQAGNTGLIKAATKFDEKKNFRFISYAVWWIRQSILQELARSSRIFKIPLNRAGTMYRIHKALEGIERTRGHSATIADVATELKLSESLVGHLTNSMGPTCSIDKEDDKGVPFGDRLAAKEDNTVEQQEMEHLVREILDRVGINERERQAVKMYFGVDYPTSYTLEEIGQHMGITRERVRQLRDKAMKVISEYCKEHKIQYVL